MALFYGYRASDDSQEIIVKFEDVRKQSWQEYAEFLEIFQDFDPDSTLSTDEAAQYMGRWLSLDDTVTKIKEPAREGAL